ncbi:prephenate dehydrogenase [Yoonia maricola]|uniref:Prephenate dehydrogenase n=1 Tax=Yoonia maricola TaxID=420999 RepID=A0A2M8W155_9RHOB|nr:prephenate dehydrogenase/arogenate dehydrogenase family protein [Yoonia maricola]PJI84638.1 prephenate dehydrogenase [Yoonia maricola]
MKIKMSNVAQRSVGIVGFGAFGKLIAQNLYGHFDLKAYDPRSDQRDVAAELGVTFTSLQAVARCDVIVIAAPVSSFEDVLTSIATVCHPGTLVIDVGSVKVHPSDLMEKYLPDYVDIVATHPLFGPQSACDGIEGLKIAVCPIRGLQHWPLAAFFRKHLGLQVIMTTPHDHDREAATVQGLTHLIAKVLHRMGPMPSRMTTRSFDLLVEAVSMVQNDAPEVFDAIENANPYSAGIRRKFFDLAHELGVELENNA